MEGRRGSAVGCRLDGERRGSAVAGWAAAEMLVAAAVAGSAPVLLKAAPLGFFASRRLPVKSSTCGRGRGRRDYGPIQMRHVGRTPYRPFRPCTAPHAPGWSAQGPATAAGLRPPRRGGHRLTRPRPQCRLARIVLVQRASWWAHCDKTAALARTEI